MHFSLTALGLAATALAATIPSEPWTTLTPDALPLGATTDYTKKFGIQIVTITGSYSLDSGAHKRAINQIGDGQIQEQTSVTLSAPATTTVASVINQIGDGQIQHQTATTASVVNQIGDGQIQHQTSTTSTTTASVINQIGDGQIQHQTANATTTASAVNQIGDGQIQHQTSTATTASAVSQISDGQLQASASASAESDDDSDIPVACLTTDSLTMTLTKTVLKDGKGRIGAIVANRQFQFDGPPPQAGSIFAAGWSITDDGLLALGNSAVFYQCKSGDFYNLYDENVAAQCEAVHLSVIDLVDC